MSTNAKLMLRNVRVAFPQLFTAKAVNGEGEPAFSAAFLLSPKHPQIAEINKIVEAVASEKWKGKAAEVLKTLRATDKALLHNGDTKSDYDGYAGNLFINARSKTAPLVLSADRVKLTEQDGKIYAGCYVYAQLEIWAQDNQFGKRVNASLKGVQFFKDGDAFAGGAPASADEFEDLSASGETETAGADLAQ